MRLISAVSGVQIPAPPLLYPIKGGTTMLFILVLATFLLVLSIALIGIYNTFIKRRNLVREAWSGIEVQLKRRHDLIPNILSTVKGYMQHEKRLLEGIAELRSRSINAGTVREKAESERGISAMLGSLFAIAEAYPELKANQNFLDLQANLANIEDQLQLARRYFNGTVRDFNTLVESFPFSIIASMFGFKSFDFFELDNTAEGKVPTIEF